MFYFRVLFDQKLYKRIEQGLSSFASIMNELKKKQDNNMFKWLVEKMPLSARPRSRMELAS
jgi:hypothetical protein